MAPPLRLRCARSSICLASALLALGAVLVVRHDNSPRPMASAGDELAAATSRAEALELERQDALRRLAARREIVGEVIEGRISLDEAARRFRELNATMPRVNQEALRCFFEGVTDEDRSRKQVTSWVHAELGTLSEPEASATAGVTRR